MGLYNFHRRFVPFIQDGRKTHTIRATRKYPDKPGDTLFLYQGLRTKCAKRIALVVCTKVEEIAITNTPLHRVSLAGHLLDQSEEEQLARADGFSSFQEMMNFWDGRLPFTGQIIHWKR